MLVKRVTTLTILALLSACRIEVDVPSSGSVLSESGAYSCAPGTTCTIDVVDIHFDETFVAEPSTGFEFSGWVVRDRGLCGGVTEPCHLETSGFADNDSLMAFLESPQETFYLQPSFRSKGFNSLFIGHSFFRPFAEQLSEHAERVGLANHQPEIVFAGGANGAPEALWNNASKRAEIQAILDRGDTELFAMTYHNEYPSLTGYRQWIDYAVERNPGIRIMITLPWLSFPEDYDSATYEALWTEFQQGDWRLGIDALRRAYPGVEIFSLPYGQSAIELRNLYAAGALSDVDTLTANPGEAIFRDPLGHADDILIELGGLVWLRAVYDVDLFSYDYSPEFEVDLKAIAQQIVDDQDPEYAAPYR
ncbi:MAG: hypothetical protein AAGC91_02750 [Pseudomonadota bacterium]